MTDKIRLALTPLLCLVLLMLGGQAQAVSGDASLNDTYAPPFGHRPDARIENLARFSYFTEQGKVHGVDKSTHGGVFSLTLAAEDVFGFELKTLWSRQDERVTYLTCAGETKDCQYEGQFLSGSQVVIGLVPQYRFLNKDWVWGSVTLETLFPLQTGTNPAKFYEINPGLQFYFNTCRWFGVELNAGALMTVMDPPDSDELAAINQDETRFVAGVNARLNLLFKIIGQHFLNVQIEDNIYFHQLEGAREQTVAQLVGRQIKPGIPQDYFDMAFYSNHRLDVGGGYRVNLKVFEGGAGAFVAITDRDKRAGWGVQVDGRFTF